MTDRYRLTDIETATGGGYVFTGTDARGDRVEVFLTACDGASGPPVRAWINRCMHEDQRLFREDVGVIEREETIVCPKHGSAFESCSGGCDNGPAAGTSLIAVDIQVADGQVYLVDETIDFLFEGPDPEAAGGDGDDDDGGPRSTSHLRF